MFRTSEQGIAQVIKTKMDCATVKTQKIARDFEQ